MIPIGDEPGPRRSFPLVTISLIVVNVLVFLYQLALGPAVVAFLYAFGVIPAEFTAGHEVGPAPPGPVWITLFTSMFLHGDLLHIGSNMLYLFVFGDNVEDRFGHIPYLIFYLVCGVAANLTHILFNPESTTPAIGASGAIAGVLAAYLVLFPRAQVRTLMFFGFVFITRLSALFLIGFWFVVQLLSGIAAIAETSEGGIAFWAHVGGFVTGLLITLAFRSRWERPGGGLAGERPRVETRSDWR